MNSKDYCVEPNQSNPRKNPLACETPACGSLGAELTPGNECTKSTACETVQQTLPRQSNTEFAQQATGRIYDTWNYAVEDEVIRARAMGRAEGRAEYATAQKQYEYQIATLKERHAWQAEQLDKMARGLSVVSRVKQVLRLHQSGIMENLNISSVHSYADGQVVYVK